MHRLLYEQAPRTPASTEKLKQFEQLLAGEVAFHLSRLGVGGGDPALTDSGEHPRAPESVRFDEPG